MGDFFNLLFLTSNQIKTKESLADVPLIHFNKFSIFLHFRSQIQKNFVSIYEGTPLLRVF